MCEYICGCVIVIELVPVHFLHFHVFVVIFVASILLAFRATACKVENVRNGGGLWVAVAQCNTVSQETDFRA